MKRISFKYDGCIHVFRYGTTTNEKICSDPKKNIVQSYTFSVDQYNYVLNSVKLGIKRTMKSFFSLDGNNCLDCPFSVNTSGKVGLCYTHKYRQYSGFISSLKSIVNNKGLLDWNEDKEVIISTLSNWCENVYVRFGSYGEPSKHPEELINSILEVCSTHTGYTHQWRKVDMTYFMASTHNLAETLQATRKGYRSFMVTEKDENRQNLDNLFAVCPASKESGKITSCDKCKLCQGSQIGAKDITIRNHA